MYFRKPVTVLITLLALTAFAANSILCRRALSTGDIGPVEFTVVRLVSALLMLLPVFWIYRPRTEVGALRGSGHTNPMSGRTAKVLPAIALFCYAIFFSLAYVRLTTGTGALLLFGSVQLTMLGINLIRGNRVGILAWAGLVTSFAGLIYLLSPGLAAPSGTGTVMMILAGASWGFYSILGQREPAAILATARNFLFCLPGALVLGAIAVAPTKGIEQFQISSHGIILATISGAIASAIGYVLWYLAIKRITTTTASIIQLLVPLLAAFGGVVFLNESLSMRLVVAGALIGGGVALSLVKLKLPFRVVQAEGSCGGGQP
jgi:drug/metabolite transporter (DMT)-like permease